MARTGQRWDHEFCAAHGGEIRGFSRLGEQLDGIEQWPQLFEREVRDLRKAARVGVAALGGAAVLGPLAFLNAGAVGGALGSALFGLTGGAATTSGLAALGLGSLAAGGYGMAGGVAVVTTFGVATGGVLSGVVANAYMGEVKGFSIDRVHGGRGDPVLVINGFLTQADKEPAKQWLPVLGERFAGRPAYVVRWESKRLASLGKTLGSTGGRAALRVALRRAAARATRKGAARLNPVGAVLTAGGLVHNDWHVAMVKAAQCGHLLADILARTPQRYTLLGHSLGARVIYYALRALAGREQRVVRDAHLLGGAVGREPVEDWAAAAAACNEPIHNYWSERDQVLNILYRAGTFLIGSPAIGAGPIGAEGGVVDHDVSDVVAGHSLYKASAIRFL